jgi:hypothetical protein
MDAWQTLIGPIAKVREKDGVVHANRGGKSIPCLHSRTMSNRIDFRENPLVIRMETTL